MVQALAFYVFAAVTVASAFLVIAVRNPVHSVLFLILAFLNGAALFILLGAEFIAMIVLIVYIGAVAVLFLFVVMMLDIDIARVRQGFLQYLPIGALVGIILLIELALVLGSWVAAPGAHAVAAAPAPAPSSAVTNTEALGLLLYTKYVYFFQAAGIVLLIAMVGAIVLTHRTRTGVKRQSIARQVARTPDQGMEIVKVRPGQGLT